MQNESNKPKDVSSDRNSLSFDSAEERREFWMAVVQEQIESGLSANAFCREQGLSPSSFHHWKQKDKLKREPDIQSRPSVVLEKKVVANIERASAPRFAEVKISQPLPVGGNGIEIKYGDFLLTLQPRCDRGLLKDLLSMLGELPC
jgi:hypothetical protein